jgi:hypothetical protein
VYDQTSAQFFVLLSSGGALTPQIGTPGDVNIPLYGDYNGDGKTEPAVYDQTKAKFVILQPGHSNPTTTQFGDPSHVNIPIPSIYAQVGENVLSVREQATRSASIADLIAEPPDATSGNAVNASASGLKARSRGAGS